MKLVSTMALGLALAFGGAASMVAVAPAAAKDKAAKPKAVNLSDSVRNALAAADKAMNAGDFPTATSQIAAASAAAKTNDEKFFVGQYKINLGTKSNNAQLQAEGVDEALASGGVPAEDLGKFYFFQGQFAYQAKNYKKAEQAFSLSQQNNYNDPSLMPLLAEAQYQSGNKPAALATLQKGIAAMKAANQPVPAEWYGRAVAMAYDAKLGPQATDLTQQWVAAYPTKSNWRDALVIYRELNNPDADTQLDLMRLMRATGSLTGQADYMEYAQATYLKYPGEAKAVLDEGIAAGALQAGNQNVKEMLGIVSGKIQADKASLAGAKNPSSGRAAMLTGDAFLGYKDYANAIDLYKQALAKGGADANVVNTRLAFAYAQSGQKDAAKQALAQITGPRANLAKYIGIWVDQKA